MREVLFRIVSGGLFGLVCYITIDALLNGLDFAPSLDDWVVMISGLIIAPTFGVFAILGERAAYRVLLPGMALIQLPQIVLDAIVQRTVDLPAYLRDPGGRETREVEPGESDAAAPPTRSRGEDK